MKSNLLIKTLLLLVSSILYFTNTNAQKHQERYNAIDVLHYRFDLQLFDSIDEIKGVAEVKVRFKKALNYFNLDFVKKNADGKGMTISSVLENEIEIPYQHEGDQLLINIGLSTPDEIRTYKIKYFGVPIDGLIISKNKYGEKTFFGDNWPDRGKNWLPIVDHPSDKATVEWIITTPSYYQVVGSGTLVEKTNISNTHTLTHWEMTEPISTKVMVIGVARFAFKKLVEVQGIPVSIWVYPQDKAFGFHNYAIASSILDYFINQIGPYPFKKLANVQSKTRFGGMENASNIFYAENRFNTNNNEGLIVHEIAHQWFGNSASELSWHHLWLSEGFATYFTSLYFENKNGLEDFTEIMKNSRGRIVNFAKHNLTPIINTNVENYLELLNVNTYHKAAWVLHMLRKELGDQLFYKSIRTYYENFKFSNALTEDFQHIIEDISGKSFSIFFNQWLYMSGHPQLEISWDYKKTNLNIEINQIQKNNHFIFPIDLKMNYGDGESSIKTVQIFEKSEHITIPSNKQIISLEVDPNTWLLYELISLKEK